MRPQSWIMKRSPVQSDRRSVGRPRVSDLRSHVDLRICILENSHIEILSTRVFQTYPMRELRCPCGLQEADFLDLLRSTFPQLAANEPFDIFWSDRSRLLKPLKVKALTPEEISSTIKSTGAGKSPLYIRLKNCPVQELKCPRGLPEADFLDLLSSTKSHPSAANSSHNHVTLRICILDNPKINVILPRAFKKWPVQELKCPRGLQEADFLDCSGPPSLSWRAINPSTSSRSTETDVEASEGGGSDTREDRQDHQVQGKIGPPFDKEMKPIHPPQRKDAAAENSHSKLNTSAQSGRRRPGRPRRSDPQSYVDLSLRLLEDPQVNVLSDRVFREYPLQELKCPCGLQEPDFVDLLRSTFPQLAGDKPFDI
ncbi:hypothetical protein INR49_008363 [Caranx melampygus]|nr:hypothetical protein INR49_008363 [Caranx melampygus]